MTGGDSGAVLGSIVEHTGAVVYRYRLWPEPAYEYVSESVRGLLGYTPEDLYADPSLPARIVHPEDRQLMTSVLDAPDGKEIDVALRWIRRDGAVVNTDLRIVVTRDDSGRPIQVDGVVRQVLPHEGGSPEAGAGESARAAAPSVVRVVIADDHELTRTGLRAVLSDQPGLVIVGEATTGHQAVDLVRVLQPELVLMDVRMPGLDGIEATRLLNQESTRTRVLILSNFDDSDLFLKAVQAGAAGYALKGSNEAELREAIWAALRNELPVDRALAAKGIRRIAQQQPSPLYVEQGLQTSPPVGGEALSSREREVLVQLARGCTNREIADALSITHHTVKVHVEHILAKLGVSHRTQAVVRAIELGYIAPPSPESGGGSSSIL